MDGIAAADVALTMAFMRNIELSDQGFIRYALNVSFFTNYNLIHSGMVDHTTCPWCPAEDSVLHRHWHCPATADQPFLTNCLENPRPIEKPNA